MGRTSAEGNDAETVIANVDDGRLPPGLPSSPSALWSVQPRPDKPPSADIMDVVSAITSGDNPKSTMQQALEAMALIRSVYAASTLSRPVLFADVSDGEI